MNAQFNRSLSFVQASFSHDYSAKTISGRGPYNSYAKASATHSIIFGLNGSTKLSHGINLGFSSDVKSTFQNDMNQIIEKSMKYSKLEDKILKTAKQNFMQTNHIDGLDVFINNNPSFSVDTSMYSGLESNAIDFTDPNRGPIREPVISDIENVFQNTKDIRRYFNNLFQE